MIDRQDTVKPVTPSGELSNPFDTLLSGETVTAESLADIAWRAVRNTFDPSGIVPGHSDFLYPLDIRTTFNALPPGKLGIEYSVDKTGGFVYLHLRQDGRGLEVSSMTTPDGIRHIGIASNGAYENLTYDKNPDEVKSAITEAANNFLNPGVAY